MNGTFLLQNIAFSDINLDQYLKDKCKKVNPFSFAKKDELLKNFLLPFCDASILHFLVLLSFVKQSLILAVATSDDRSGFTNKKISAASEQRKYTSTMPPETNRLFVHVKILPCPFPGQIASFRPLVKTVSILLRPVRYLTLVIRGDYNQFQRDC